MKQITTYLFMLLMLGVSNSLYAAAGDTPCDPHVMTMPGDLIAPILNLAVTQT